MNEIFIDGDRVPIRKITINKKYDIETVPKEYKMVKTTVFGEPRWIPVAKNRYDGVPHIIGEEIWGEIELTNVGWDKAEYPGTNTCVDIETDGCVLKDVFFNGYELGTDVVPTIRYVARRAIPKDEIPADKY